MRRELIAKDAPLTVAERWQTVGAAAREIGPTLFFSLLIITVSFLPVFRLQAQEGRLFAPLAFTKTYAMAAAAFLAITLVPVLMGYFIRGRILPEARNALNRLLHRVHSPLLGAATHWRWLTLALALVLLGGSLYPFSRLGSEFMPPLDEGDILYMSTTYPGLSITKAKELLQQTDKILATFPEVASVFGKVGRAQTATDPAPLSMIETTVRLRPRQEWPHPAKTTRDLMNEMDEAIRFPGLANAWTMPIKTRIDMLSTGIKTPVGIKVSGPDLGVLERVAGDIDQLKRVLIPTPTGAQSPSSLVADLRLRRGPPVIKSENSRPNAWVYVDIKTSDVGGYVARAKKMVQEQVDIPAGYTLVWSGQYEYMERAAKRLRLVVPVTLLLIFLLLYLNFRNVTEPLVVMLSIPFGSIGGFWLVYWLGFNVSVAAAVGFIALAGVAAEIGVLVLTFIDHEVARRRAAKARSEKTLVGGPAGDADADVAGATGTVQLESAEIMVAVHAGTAEPVRPVVMTAAAIIAGLLPIMWGSRTGSEVMQRIAAPMVGGMVTVTILSLLVLPVIYGIVLQLRERRRYAKQRTLQYSEAVRD
jgi:Cu(I)/Ag(I) efflux system membrane protein CusA/SilA